MSVNIKKVFKTILLIIFHLSLISMYPTKTKVFFLIPDFFLKLTKVYNNGKKLNITLVFYIIKPYPQNFSELRNLDTKYLPKYFSYS